ncbi:MAG: GTP-binding protein, partial [Cyanobacteria bacterium J06621_8]
ITLPTHFKLFSITHSPTPKKVDHLVIETTGLADPLPIIITFLSTELKYLTSVDAVVTVIDASSR